MREILIVIHRSSPPNNRTLCLGENDCLTRLPRSVGVLPPAVADLFELEDDHVERLGVQPAHPRLELELNIRKHSGIL